MPSLSRSPLTWTISLTVGGILAAAACSPAPGPAPGAREAPAPVAPAAPVAPGAATAAVLKLPDHDPKAQYGGKLQIGSDRPVESLLSYPDASSNPGVYLTKIMYEPLLWMHMDTFPKDYRDNYFVAPLLAESWELKDPTTYVFKIRQGVKWHDGEEFTAEDPAWSYDHLRDPKNTFPTRSFIDGLATSRVIDKYTLELKSKLPDNRFLTSLANERVSIWPKHVVAGGKGDLTKQPVGTGPYKFKAWTSKVEISYARNEQYWGKRPYLDEMRYVTNLDRAAVTAAFITKQSDVMQLPDKAQADAIARQAPDAVLTGYVRLREVSMFMKLDKPPFNDIRVRKALHLALDRKSQNDTLSFGLGIANPPGINGRRIDWAIPQEELLKLPGYRQPKDQDIAEAKKLLAEAGFGSGLKFTLRADSRHSTGPKQAEYLAEDLKAAGFDIKLEIMERAAFRKAFSEGDYEAVVETGSDWDPTEYWFNTLLSTGSENKAPINDKELDGLIEANIQAVDTAKQKQTAQALQRLLLDKLYLIPTITYSSFTAFQPYLHGWTINFGGSPSTEQWYYVWVEKDKLPPGR